MGLLATTVAASAPRFMATVAATRIPILLLAASAVRGRRPVSRTRPFSSNWDGRPFGGNGPWYISRFEPMASTPFEQSVQEYIAKELPR